jgi:hypothetical protein
MKKSLGTLLLTGVLVATAACDADPASSAPARVSLLLTDAPGDFASAEVEIEEIYLLGSGQNNDEDAGPGGRSSCSPVRGPSNSSIFATE